MNKPILIASFVDLAQRHTWSEVKELHLDEAKILFEIVSAAGFEPTEVVPGKLRGDYRDQDGSATGETYSINSFCPYTVLGQGGKNHFRATGWLDQLLYLASKKGERELILERIRDEIERSVPLKPIRLTAEGDMLREYPPPINSDYFTDHTRDDRELGGTAGVHDICGGWVDRVQTTRTHDALLCRRCHLRVPFPKEIKTYGELRQAMSSKLLQASA